MKKNRFKKITKIFSSLAVAMMAANSMAGIQDGSHNKSSFKDETLSLTSLSNDGLSAGEGKAILGITDAKTFLGLNGLGANSQAVAQTAGFTLEIPHEVKEVLKSQILKIEKDRSDLLVKLDAESESKKAAVRAERKALQMKRISNNNNANDVALGKSLFNNLISESSIETKIQQELNLFDETNTIALSFIEIGGTRHVQAIQIGMESIWKMNSSDKQWAMLR
jgi:hypothetical protein